MPRSAAQKILTVLLICAGAIALLLSLTKILPERHLPRRSAEIGVLVEHTSRTIDSHFSSLAARLGESHGFHEVTLGDTTAGDSGASGVPDSIDVLIVLGSGHLPDAQLYEIDQFIMRGGSAAFFLDGAAISEDRVSAEIVRGNMFAFVGSYGATAEPDLVVDVEGGARYDKEGDDSRHPYWPTGIPASEGPARTIMPESGDVVFTWASSIAPGGQRAAGGAVEVLARSGGDSWSTLSLENLDPAVEPQPNPVPPGDTSRPEPGNHVLAAAIDGTLRSAFSGMPVIVERGDGSVDFTDPPGRLSVSPPTSLIVTGSSTMFEDWAVERFPANLDFLENAIAWLAE